MQENEDLFPIIYLVPEETKAGSNLDLDSTLKQSTVDAVQKQFVTDAAINATTLPSPGYGYPDRINIFIAEDLFEVDFSLNENNFYDQLFEIYTLGGWESILATDNAIQFSHSSEDYNREEIQRRNNMFVNARNMLAFTIHNKMKSIEIKALSQAVKKQVKARGILGDEVVRYQITPVEIFRTVYDEFGRSEKEKVITYVFREKENLRQLIGLIYPLLEIAEEIVVINNKVQLINKNKTTGLDEGHAGITDEELKKDYVPPYQRSRNKDDKEIKNLNKNLENKQTYLSYLLSEARKQNHPICEIAIHLLNKKNFKAEIENTLGKFIYEHIELQEAVPNIPVLKKINFDIFNPGNGFENLLAEEIGLSDNALAIEALLFSLFNDEENQVVDVGSIEYIVLNRYILTLSKWKEEAQKSKKRTEEILAVTSKVLSAISLIAWAFPPLGVASFLLDMGFMTVNMGYVFAASIEYKKELRQKVAESAAGTPEEFYSSLTDISEYLQYRPDVLIAIVTSVVSIAAGPVLKSASGIGPLMNKISTLGERAFIGYGFYSDLKTIFEIPDII